MSTFPESGAQSWGVAWTKSKCEKALIQYLSGRRVSHYLPLIAKRRCYGSRIRRSYLPLFPGYVFYDTAAIERAEVFASRRVVDVLYPPDEPKLRADLSNLSIALSKDEGLRAARFGEIGRIVTIKGGSLKGLTGELVRIGSQSRLIVRIHFLGKAAELEIDDAFIDA
jgi:transcriptional antiterminator RfaH